MIEVAKVKKISTVMNDLNFSRRRFVQSAGAVAAFGATGLAMRSAEAGELPKVDENGPMAKALNYVHDAKTADAAKRMSVRFCYNCALYAGGEDDAWAECSIFPGKVVAGAGWCSAWAPKQNAS